MCEVFLRICTYGEVEAAEAALLVIKLKQRSLCFLCRHSGKRRFFYWTGVCNERAQHDFIEGGAF